jgi:hypothetical protein
MRIVMYNTPPEGEEFLGAEAVSTRASQRAVSDRPHSGEARSLLGGAAAAPPSLPV